MRLATHLSAFLYMFFLVSCYKVEVEANALPQGYSVAQVVGTWKITAVSSDKEHDWDGNGISEKDVYSTWSECQKDNLYHFNSDKSGTFKLNCSSTETGSWDLDGTITLVWLYSGTTTQFEKIISLTSNTMKTEILKEDQGQLFTLTRTWALQ